MTRMISPGVPEKELKRKGEKKERSGRRDRDIKHIFECSNGSMPGPGAGTCTVDAHGGGDISDRRVELQKIRARVWGSRHNAAAGSTVRLFPG